MARLIDTRESYESSTQEESWTLREAHLGRASIGGGCLSDRRHPHIAAVSFLYVWKMLGAFDSANARRADGLLELG